MKTVILGKDEKELLKIKEGDFLQVTIVKIKNNVKELKDAVSMLGTHDLFFNNFSIRGVCYA